MKSDKLINFGELLKEAWQYIWSFKYLWLLGILAGGGISASTNNFSYFLNSGSDAKDWQSLSNHTVANGMPSMGRVLGASDSAISAIAILVVTIVALAFCLVLIYLNITARGAIISAVDKLDLDKKFSLAESWHYGHKYFWKILGFNVLFALLIIIPTLFLAAPIIMMVVVKWYIPAVIVGLFFLLIFIVYVTYISLSIQYGERILVLENKGAWDSIKLGTQFLNKNWKNVLLTYLILIAVMVGAGTVLAIGVLLVGGILFAIAFGIYLLNQTVAIIIAIPFGLALFCALLVANGMISSYQSTLLTLVYKEIKSNN